jgi:MFS family permease
VLVIPAIAALVADNYTGRDRVIAYAIIGAVSGAAAAAGPLIGGFVTTYLDWRFVFFSEVFIMLAVVAFWRIIRSSAPIPGVRIDALSVLLSAAGLVLIVFGMLQSKDWGWILPMGALEVGGVSITPLGLSVVPFLIIIGFVLLRLFWVRQQKISGRGDIPLVDVSIFSIRALRSGLGVLGAQYAIIGGVFFMIPVYLQMTLGLDALETGLRIFPLSLALMLFSFVGTRLAKTWSPRRIVQAGQLILVASVLVLLGSVNDTLDSILFGIGMFTAGMALGLLASQLGNVNMSAVDQSQSSEVGGVQGVFQNLGSSLGTALIGSVLIASLTTSFAGAVASSNMPDTVKTEVSQLSEKGIEIVPASSVSEIAEKQGLSKADSEALEKLYTDSQVSSLRMALFALLLFSMVTLLLSRGIPNQVLDSRKTLSS